MLSLCGYSFCGGKDALNPLPTDISNIKSARFENAIFDHVNASRDALFPYNNNLPVWDIYTTFDCGFTNDTNAGNVNFTLDQLNAVKIKRRKKGEYNWITIRKIPITSKSDLDAVIKDYFVPSYEEFEYAIVPILNGIEGEYIINTISTEFNGVFITDVTKSFKLDKNVGYNNRSSVQDVGRISTLSGRYPIVIKNGETSYEIGSVSGLLLGENYDDTRKINRKEVVQQINEFIEFLKNGNPKIIKDLIK